MFLKSRPTQKSTKGNGRRQRSKVDEDDGGHALRVQSISEVAEVLRVASRHIFDQTSEKMARTSQGLIARFGGNEGIWKITWSSEHQHQQNLLLMTCCFTLEDWDLHRDPARSPSLR